MRRRTLTTALAAAVTAGAAAPAAAGGPGSGTPGGLPAGSDPSAPRPAGGKGRRKPRRLMPGTGLYPRAIRLAHNGAADGRLLASVVTFEGPRGTGAVFESTDDGATFEQIGEVGDEATTGGEGLCCATLYELPDRVGDLPAGTLLWAASVGADTGEDRRMSIRIWASTDVGRSWERIAITHTASNAGGLWEPEFALADDGTLVMWFCDETDGERHSQKIVQQTSTDAVTWTEVEETIALADPTARPGMPNVRRLHDGRWLMSYEVCGPNHLCRIHMRTSDDPRSWGPVTHLDPVIRAADGTEPRHTPTILVDDDGSVLLGAQMQYAPDGDVSHRNGKIALRSKRIAEGVPWVTERVPVPVKDPWDNYCPNYSPTFVRSAAGDLVQITSAPNADEVCEAWVGSRR
ncbi:exo-alpha-sialidase [Brachybacterium timonense]|uniref:exo-alpha-sialidase n=1 Tax=Brachybacterium timonense TaxID=2050896 RepID=UPI000D0BE720|nr:sialidase family protein [Brachybacterium timonense]